MDVCWTVQERVDHGVPIAAEMVGHFLEGGWGTVSAGRRVSLVKPSCPPPPPPPTSRDPKRRERQAGGEGEEDGPEVGRGQPEGLSRPPSHDGAALSFLLLEGGGEQVGLAGQVEQSLGEAAGGAGLGQGLQLVDAGQRGRAEHAVDALLGGEGGALQVGLRTQLLGHG